MRFPMRSMSWHSSWVSRDFREWLTADWVMKHDFAAAVKERVASRAIKILSWRISGRVMVSVWDEMELVLAGRWSPAICLPIGKHDVYQVG